MSRPIFIYPKVTGLDRPEDRSFVNSTCRRDALVQEVGYIPLKASQYELVRSRFTSRKTGSV